MCFNMAMLNKHSPEVNRMLCSFEGDAPLLQAAPFILADRDRDRDEYALLGSLALPFPMASITAPLY